MYRDLGTDTGGLEVLRDDGTRYLDDIDWAFSNYVRERYSFRGDDFSSACGEVLTRRSWERAEWKASISNHTRMTCDNDFFYVQADLDAWHGEKRIFSKSWDEKIPRRLV
jgi:hypothetical protein